MKRVWLSWSSGKDSAWTLHALRQAGEVEVVGLLTTINSEFQRVAMHAVRRRLLEAQAESVGLSLRVLELPWPCSNEQYEAAMAPVWEEASGQGVEAVAFGDLFLEDVRDYRIAQLQDTGLQPFFPLWGSGTAELAAQMIDGGLRARITCVDPGQLTADFAGQEYDRQLLRKLPPGVDPCGERGEFHTVVYDGPMFEWPLKLVAGEVVERDGFVFGDFRLADGREGSRVKLQRSRATKVAGPRASS